MHKSKLSENAQDAFQKLHDETIQGHVHLEELIYVQITLITSLSQKQGLQEQRG